jgi:peptide/nickel transport system ATP-binding protein
MSEPLLAVDDLGIVVDHRALVHDVSLHVGRGEAVALVGESGSGKSLTARALVALLPVGLTATGRLGLAGAAGTPIAAAAEHRGRSVALLLQDPFTMLNPMMTAGAHLAETLVVSGRDRAGLDAEVARRLGEVGITDPAVAQRYPFELSGGMAQRVALAAALANDPDVLVADEPTTALDATTQHDVLELLRSIQRQRGMGLVLITHDLRVAFSLCDRVMVMYAGSIVEQASADAVREAPLHPYTAGLLASVPSTDRYQARLVGIDGTVPATHTVLDRCAFADRCAHRAPECLRGAPPLVEVAPGRSSACRRIAEIGPLTAVVGGGATRPHPTPHDTVVLRVEGLAKVYRSGGSEHHALRGVSFEVRDGEALGIVGESGSGKTTIARCLMGLVVASSGRIEFPGVEVGDLRRRSSAQRRAAAQVVQCVFQDPYSTLNPMHTVGAALAEALAYRQRPVADRVAEVQSLLRRVGLPPELAERRPVALSGGQRQRVAIARALAVEPRVLLCDEPVAALDVSVQAQVLELLREVNRQGTSLLFITHDLGVVRQVTERVLVLLRGEVVEQGATDSVLDHPSHEYTRRLVASMPSLEGEGGRG